MSLLARSLALVAVSLMPAIAIQATNELDARNARLQELRKAIDFCRRNGAESLTVTTRTQTATIEEGGVRLDFIPAALYCFKTGYSLLQLRSFTAPSGT